MNEWRYRRAWSNVFLMLLVAAVGACAPAPSVPVTLDVPGRADATPSVASTGSFVAVAWGASAGGRADVYLTVSRDGGSTFGARVRVNADAGEARLGGEFPPRVALVPVRDSRVPEIAVLWTTRGEAPAIKVSRSRDGGRTFDTAAALQSPTAAGDRGWPAMALDREAGVHAIWLDHRGLAAARAAATRHTSHERGAAHDGVAMAQKSGLYYASLTGEVSPERELTTGVCYCCKTALAAGPDGSLYAAWRHVYPGNLRDIAFTVSRDAGRSFSPPIRVSEDGWAINGCPDDGPAIAVDSGGGVHIVWPTVVNHPNPQGALFYASTRDGRRFTPRVQIPTLGGLKPSHPQIAVDREGRILVAWDESVGGERAAAARELMPQRDGTATFGDVVKLSARGPAIYPVVAATDKGWLTAWADTADQSRVEVRLIQTR